MEDPEIKWLAETREKLDRVSPCFCLAKWKQVTIHLQSGDTHSCHHPNVHKIPLDELRRNPGALHNTKFKIEQRRLMLKGQRPKECGYCWTMEDAGPGDLISDRVMKSSEGWAEKHFDEVKNGTFGIDVLPSYVEVSFSNVCNFKCSYCGPHSSSKWQEEIKQHGGFPTSTKFNHPSHVVRSGRTPIPPTKRNPYLEAWRKWWPELYPKLEVFRITGGEPLLSKETFRTLEYIQANPRADLELGINSNLGVPESIFEKFIALAKDISDNGKVKAFHVFTSIDTWGRDAEYLRFGLDCAQFHRNLDRLLSECPNVHVVIMCTFNALSPFRFRELLDVVLALKIKYARKQWAQPDPLVIDISYLRHPAHQSLPVLGGRFNSLLREAYAFMESHAGFSPGQPQPGFTKRELEKMRRLVAWSEGPPPVAHTPMDSLPRRQRDLVRFVDEHDRRRGTRFLETFPQLADFHREFSIAPKWKWDSWLARS